MPLQNEGLMPGFPEIEFGKEGDLSFRKWYALVFLSTLHKKGHVHFSCRMRKFK
jgi:hypothetical protein